MKSVTVLVFVLTIIHYLDIGDAISSKKIKAINEQKKLVIENIDIFKEIIDETMIFLNTTMDEHVEIFTDRRENALSIIKDHAVSTGKTENNVAKICINSAQKQLRTTSTRFLRMVKKAYKYPNEQATKVTEYKLIITEGEFQMERFEKILNGIPEVNSEKAKSKYNKFRRRIRTLKSGSIVLKRKILLKKIETIIENAKKCIEKA